ncbi:PGPGW domain-containing protein [Streptomyces sp. WMMC1477]|uniref:PGPGW domain-containing protein n=1 Tax=Streptomyces sp. WMMC1477 TaxID=3015155 RepID=UPI0022B6525A|nr:PGPGW domain-containing protein [Streptomyces sp. WMMC1477]MCZ7433219.1 PGPGW domain-containing protein [Streptomyces sp. WMMC1477]
MVGHVKRVVLVTLGGVLVLAGIAMLVLPGPGLLAVFAGMVLLARAVPALERHVEPVRARAMEAAEQSVSSSWRLAWSSLVGLALIGAGVAWALVPGLPLGSWSAGTSLIVSGVVLWVLLAWSYRRVRAERARTAGAPTRGAASDPGGRPATGDEGRPATGDGRARRNRP